MGNIHLPSSRSSLDKRKRKKRRGIRRIKEEEGKSEEEVGTSLVIQWLKIRLPMLGKQSSAPSQGRSHMLWGNWAHAPQHKEAPQWEVHVPLLKNRPCSLQLEKACAQQRKPSTTKIKMYKKSKNEVVVVVEEIEVTEEGEEEEEEMGQFHWIPSSATIFLFPKWKQSFCI